MYGRGYLLVMYRGGYSLDPWGRSELSEKVNGGSLLWNAHNKTATAPSGYQASSKQPDLKDSASIVFMVASTRRSIIPYLLGEVYPPYTEKT